MAKNKTMDNQTLYDWIFRFNPMDNMWYGVKRDSYNDLFSDLQSKNVLKSSSIKTLTEIINKTDGDIKKINSLLKKDK
jgi:DNA-directed RNA polymerase alpha subunit